MTKEVIVRLRDDLSKQLGESVETREFTIDGVEYESELSAENYAKFLKATEKFRTAARPKKRRAVKKAAAKKKPKTEAGLVREWARETGRECNPRGSVPPELLEEYRVAHPPPEGSEN